MKAFGRRDRQDPLSGLPPELQRVLDAAAAPGRPSELEGLSAATAAFMSSTPPERAVSWSLAKLVATPVAAVVAVTGLTGGVALAAATGSLPDAVQDFAANLGAPAADRDETDGPATPTATVKLNRGRCVAVTMGNKTTQGKALQTAPLSAAASACPSAAAPGSNRSETATAILESKPAKSAKPTAKPDKSAKPARTAPAGRPTDAGKPTSQPTAWPEQPAARPTDAGKPTAKPSR